VTGKPIIVRRTTRSWARSAAPSSPRRSAPAPSSFKGFGVVDTKYEVETFECQDCPNRCEINKVLIEGESPCSTAAAVRSTTSGSMRRKRPIASPNLFREREKMLLEPYVPAQAVPEDALRIGIPRALLTHDLFPFWQAVVMELGGQVVLSARTNKRIIHRGAEASVAETCFPVKVALGHVLSYWSRRSTRCSSPASSPWKRADDLTSR